MTSSYAKGNKHENEVKKILEARGYVVEGQHRKAMYIGKRLIMCGRDIFGCDIIAKKFGKDTLWIQVGMIEHKSDKLRQVKDQPWNCDDEVQLWLREIKNRRIIYRVFAFDIITKKLYEREPVDFNSETKGKVLCGSLKGDLHGSRGTIREKPDEEVMNDNDCSQLIDTTRNLKTLIYDINEYMKNHTKLTITIDAEHMEDGDMIIDGSAV